MRLRFALVSVALFVAACSKESDTGRVPLGAAAPPQATSPALSPSSATGDVLTGTLVEQIAAAPYVYLRLKTETGEVWAAVNQTPLTNGAQVSVYNALLMEQFESKSLNRTFDRIYFGSLEAPGAASAGGEAAPTSVGAPPAVDAKVGAVEKARGADARTIGELWAQRATLSGKSVSIRGVVVKYNAGVMGKNWIHLQDGSGDAAAGTHDITVTSMDAAAMGATVTITGTVRVNKDFGAGYTYALIVEDAKVVVK
jgi:hypothetical protein